MRTSQHAASALHRSRSLGCKAVGFGALVVGCGGANPPAASPEAPTEVSASETDTDPNHPPTPPPAKNAGKPIESPLLDDLEDGDGQIILADARAGYWYTYKDDGTSIEPANPFQPSEGGANGSKYAARVKGNIGDATQYPFAGMGFLFLDPKGAYDVTGCEGIKFFARKGDEGATANMRLKVGDVNTVPEGGLCKECYNDFGRDILLTDEWTEITAPFFEMKQEPYWGESHPQIVTSHLYQVQFQVVARGTFDFWVDDVALYGCKTASE